MGCNNRKKGNGREREDSGGIYSDLERNCPGEMKCPPVFLLLIHFSPGGEYVLKKATGPAG